MLLCYIQMMTFNRHTEYPLYLLVAKWEPRKKFYINIQPLPSKYTPDFVKLYVGRPIAVVWTDISEVGVVVGRVGEEGDGYGAEVGDVASV